MTPTPPATVRKTRFQFSRGGRLQFRVGMPGIICTGLPAQDGLPGLVLVWDEGPANLGTSATNGIEDILLYLQSQWGAQTVGAGTVVVERDSDGLFDYACVAWKDGGALAVGWAPVTWAGCEPRSLGAFYGLFGARGRQLSAAAFKD